MKGQLVSPTSTFSSPMSGTFKKGGAFICLGRSTSYCHAVGANLNNGAGTAIGWELAITKTDLKIGENTLLFSIRKTTFPFISKCSQTKGGKLFY